MADLPLTWNVFLIRIWHETTSDAWRGQVTHLATHQVAYFDTIDQMQAFIAEYVPDINRPSKSQNSINGSMSDPLAAP